jgi:hypothetical protein
MLRLVQLKKLIIPQNDQPSPGHSGPKRCIHVGFTYAMAHCGRWSPRILMVQCTRNGSDFTTQRGVGNGDVADVQTTPSAGLMS